MADEKVNASPEEKKAPEAPAPVRAGRSARAGTHRGPCCPWWGSSGPLSCGACRWGTYPADRSPRYG